MNRFRSWNLQVRRAIWTRNRESLDLLKIASRREAKLLAAIAAGGLVLSPAFAASTSSKRPPAISLSFDPISSFTPANADPKLAAALAGRGLSLHDFKFTPAPAKGRPSQVRVAIRARTASPAQTKLADASAPTAVALAPTTYNLGVAVGWRRFAVAGDVAKVKEADLRLADARAPSSASATRSRNLPAASLWAPSAVPTTRFLACARATTAGSILAAPIRYRSASL